jgi:flagellar hook-associated protein 2
MASSVSSVNASAMSSIYGNRNVISGLASGLDTESMIENAVSGIKMKISGLQQDKTKIQWEQEAIRSIIDKLVDFNQKYTSYASDTNLMSASFFNSAVKVSTAGKFADLISASGKTSSNVQILGVKQLATSAKYTITGLNGIGSSGNPSISAKDTVNFDDDIVESTVSGTLSITYGTKKINLSFDKDDVYGSAEDFANAINEKLQNLQVTNSDGETVSASTMVKAELKDGKITFSEANNAGNEVYISGASGDIKTTLGIDGSKKNDSINMSGVELSSTTTVGDAISGQELTFTLDGVTKTITLPEYSDDMTDEELLKSIQDQLKDKFGDKITVTDEDTGDGFQLKFEINSLSTLSISGDAVKALGLGDGTATSYIDTGKTLEDLGVDFSNLSKVEATDVHLVAGTKDSYVDKDGNAVKQDADGKYYRVDEKGDFLYELKINDKVVGNYSKNTALESIILDINNSDAGVSVTYSKTTNQFQFAATETGESGKIEFGEGLAQTLFGDTKQTQEPLNPGDVVKATYTRGQDAIFTMDVNGQQQEVKRSSNSFEVDGLTVNLKGAFGYDGDSLATDAEAVTFTSTTDADKIVDAVKSFVEDYNAMITEIKNAYSTMPAQKSDGSSYEPLTSDDSEGMTESEIEAYEEKAKQGILFADRDISDLYSALNSAINPGGTDASFLRSIGIDTAYSDGLTTLKLDEDALRAALESDPDGVKDAFTKTVSGGASTDGLMQSLKTAVDKYGKETGTKGILLTRAGSVKAPTTLNDNTLQDKLNDLDDEIEKWQDQLSTKIDWYTSQFTQLEQLILQMNSQSSTLSGLMGGGSY